MSTIKPKRPRRPNKGPRRPSIYTSLTEKTKIYKSSLKKINLDIYFCDTLSRRRKITPQQKQNLQFKLDELKGYKNILKEEFRINEIEGYLENFEQTNKDLATNSIRNKITVSPASQFVRLQDLIRDLAEAEKLDEEKA